jgi:chemotaxis protein CheD
VGQRNTQFVMEYLKTERIPIVSKDVLEIYPRKVCFMPASGRALVKRLAATQPETILAQDRLALQRAAPPSTGGSIDLF